MRTAHRQCWLISGSVTLRGEVYRAVVRSDLSAHVADRVAFLRVTVTPVALVRLGAGGGRLYGGADVDRLQERLLQSLETQAAGM